MRRDLAKEMEHKMTDHPNCRALGLEVHSVIKPTTHINTWEFVRASDLEALLAKGVRVYGEINAANQHAWTDTNVIPGATSTALLIDIQPIKRETAEDVLRDWLRFAEASPFAKDDSMLERARRVLELKK